MALNTVRKEKLRANTLKLGEVIDHLVNALGGDPSCTVRRGLVLTDIDEHNGTTQADIMARIGVDKSSLNRDVEWLYDYGCIMRQPSEEDAREIKLHICGYAKKNLDFALHEFENSHKSLKNCLIKFINLFGDNKPTFRDIKILSVVGSGDVNEKQDILDQLYDGPTTTDNRAINNLVDIGFIKKEEE